MVSRIFKEPLVQFLVIGLGLFALIAVLSPDQLSTQNPLEIRVNDDNLTEYLQFQRKSFDPVKAAGILQALSPRERQTLTSNYVRDEALFREALALGLNENDEIIRRRLIQKMEYIAQGFYDDLEPINEAQLQSYFRKNKDQYQIDAAITFTHVFLPVANSADDLQTRRQTEALLIELNAGPVPFERAGQYGKRFLYNLNYVERTPQYIASHFGDPFERSLFLLDVRPQWQGPVRSEFGFHLVLITEKTAIRVPELSEVAPMVLADAQREQQTAQKAEAINALLAKYTVLAAPSIY